MAVLRSVIALSRSANSGRFLLSLSLASSPSTSFPYQSHHLSSILSQNPFSRSAKFLSPLSKWISLGGPLFLSSPPWKLSQCATPLYFQSDVFLLPKVHAIELLRGKAFSVNLGLGSVPSVSNLEGGGSDAEGGRGGELVAGLVNLPNLISVSRLISGPFLGWMIIQEMYLPAFCGLVISGATDWLDGYMARKMRIHSVVGSYLDPLADKVLIGCVALAMVDKGLLHSGLVGLIVLRDIVLVGGAVYKRSSDLDWKWRTWFDFFNLDGTCPEKIDPLFISKVNTVLQLALVAVALLQPEFGTAETETYITYLSWLVAATTMASTGGYAAQHFTTRSSSIWKKL